MNTLHKLFSNNQNDVFRDTPWNYVYSDINIFVDIPEENIKRIKELNFSNTVLDLNSNEINVEPLDKNLTIVKNVITEVTPFESNIDSGIFSEIKNIKNVLDDYLKLKKEIKISEDTGTNGGYKNLDNIKTKKDSLITNGNALNFDYNNIDIIKKADILIDLFTYEKKLMDKLYVNGNINYSLKLSEINDITSKYKYYNDFNSNYFKNWKINHYNNLISAQNDAKKVKNKIITSTEDKFLSDYYDYIDTNDKLKQKEIYDDAIFENLNVFGSLEVRNKLKILERTVNLIKAQYLSHLKDINERLKNNTYEESITKTVELVKQGFTFKYDSDAIIKKNMDDLLLELEVYRKTQEKKRIEDIKIDITSFEFKNKLDEFIKFGLNKKINNKEIVEDNDSKFMKQINFIFDSLIKLEYINTYKKLNTQWKKLNNYEYRVNKDNKTFDDHKKDAEDLKSNIISILSNDEYTFVNNLFNKEIWLGAKQIGTSDTDKTKTN